MALELIDRSIFLHMPRAGGTFSTAVLRRLGLVKGPIGAKHDCPAVVPIDMTVPHHVFLRHPLSWIRSVYGWQVSCDPWPTYPKPGSGRWWHPFGELTDAPAEAQHSLSGFLEWLIADRPGFVTRLYTKFADWPTSRVMRFELIASELPALAESFGRDAGEVLAAIVAAPRNATQVAVGDPGLVLVDEFLRIESVAVRRWQL